MLERAAAEALKHFSTLVVVLVVALPFVVRAGVSNAAAVVGEGVSAAAVVGAPCFVESSFLAYRGPRSSHGNLFCTKFLLKTFGPPKVVHTRPLPSL